ncbi:MAG: hypothetical protein HY556_09940 [Euryarchaeota archaeon]|nr:hypothetical protein [Euryarchaeota archaeon]
MHEKGCPPRRSSRVVGFVAWGVALILMLVMSGGCLSNDTPAHYRLALSKQANPPEHFVNVTESDLDNNPVLKKLVEKVEGGSIAAKEEYSYEDSVRLIRSFQARDPGPWWVSAEEVYLLHNATFLRLLITKVVQ